MPDHGLAMSTMVAAPRPSPARPRWAAGR
jgi:hypothetical protein